MSDRFVRLDRQPYVDYWHERFGMSPATFAELSFYQRGRSTIWAGVPRVEELAGALVDAVGIPVLRIGARFWKPTSIALITFGSAATRNVIELDEDEMRAFLAGKECSVPESDPRGRNLGPGYVVARIRGVALGCAEWHRGTLYSLIPKGKRVASLDL
jgi:NOL1/NOP2/fmu family ribosome biogenesis protein